MQIQANDSVRALSVDLSKHQVHRADDGDRVRQERAAHHEVGSSQVSETCRASRWSARCRSNPLAPQNTHQELEYCISRVYYHHPIQDKLPSLPFSKRKRRQP